MQIIFQKVFQVFSNLVQSLVGFRYKRYTPKRKSPLGAFRFLGGLTYTILNFD